jgi:hypothetical protein
MWFGYFFNVTFSFTHFKQLKAKSLQSLDLIWFELNWIECLRFVSLIDCTISSWYRVCSSYIYLCGYLRDIRFFTFSLESCHIWFITNYSEDFHTLNSQVYYSSFHAVRTFRSFPQYLLSNSLNNNDFCVSLDSLLLLCCSKSHVICLTCGVVYALYSILVPFRRNLFFLFDLCMARSIRLFYQSHFWWRHSTLRKHNFFKYVFVSLKHDKKFHCFHFE